MAIDFPNSPTTNDTHTVNGRTYIWTGDYWKVSGTAARGLSLAISDTAPTSPTQGDLWFESDTGRTYTYYDGFWVELGNTAQALTTYLADADTDTKVHVEETADDDTIRFDTAGVERMTIGASGDIVISNDLTVDTNTFHVDSTNNRVGVGNTSPSYALDVTGDINTTGDLRIGGTAVGTWTAYTPTWTGVGSNPSIGNGVIEGRYTEINNLVVVKVRINMGSTTTYGSGRYDVSLPVNHTNSTAYNTTFGSAYFADASTATAYVGVTVAGPSASTVTFRISAGGFGDVTSTSPFTFANGDAINLIAIYEAA